MKNSISEEPRRTSFNYFTRKLWNQSKKEPNNLVKIRNAINNNQNIRWRKFRQVACIARDNASASTRDRDSARDSTKDNARDSASARELEIIEKFLHPITS